MDIKAELEANHQKQKEIVTQLDQLDDQKQELLQELLKLDGEARLLKRLDAEKGK